MHDTYLLHHLIAHSAEHAPDAVALNAGAASIH